mgnify:CR=1 FL=1
MYIYSLVQTNRESLVKFIDKFRSNKLSNEYLVAPRTLPGVNQYFYVAYIKVIDGKANHQYAKKFQGYKELDKEFFKKKVSSIKHSWSVGKKSV